MTSRLFARLGQGGGPGVAVCDRLLADIPQRLHHLLERDLDRTPAADEAFAKAVQLRRQLTGRAIAEELTLMDRQRWIDLAESYELLAPVQRQNSRAAEADNSEREAAAIRANLAEKNRAPQ